VERDRPTGVRYVLDVAPGDSGVRVSVRRRLPEGGFSDTLGVLLSWDRAELRVEKRDGTVVAIPSADVVAAKRVPPAPERRSR
jgi:hypothetical protein